MYISNSEKVIEMVKIYIKLASVQSQQFLFPSITITLFVAIFYLSVGHIKNSTIQN